MKNSFYLESPHTPTGDQPVAIAQLVCGIEDGLQYQTLLGATGTGKTFAMANVITKTNRPALIIAPNKTLCAQLYSEMKAFFPNAAVEYFVSYFDYFQPETYIPSIDKYIDKDSAVNSYLQMLRMSATESILSRNDTIIVATVSAIFGLGEVLEFQSHSILFEVGAKKNVSDVVRDMVKAQFEVCQSEKLLSAGQFKKAGDVLVIHPASVENYAVRISFFDDDIEKIEKIDPITGKIVEVLKTYILFPASHHMVASDKLPDAITQIRDEMNLRFNELKAEGKVEQANRIKERVMFDLEMMIATGYCKGIENYSRIIAGRDVGSSPTTLLDYMPDNALVFIDESHTTIPQLNGMYAGDRSRKETLINHGFRLPSAYDARPLKFSEFEAKSGQTIFVSATPGAYELEKSGADIAEQIIRPTGIVDPKIEIRPVQDMVADCMSEITDRIKLSERVLVTVISKKLAEAVSDFFNDHGIRSRFLHGEVEAVERVEILRLLRSGNIDVVVGINLLREGLDLPEVTLVAVMDADKEGFLRNAKSLIQTVGRAARNIKGHAIFYADKVTDSMKNAIAETDRRRKIQLAYNKKHKVIAKNISSKIRAQLDQEEKVDPIIAFLEDIDDNNITKILKDLEKKMKLAAKNLEFEDAAMYRNQIQALRKRTIGHE